MLALKENARAKVNLSLRVLGRRDDGYHQIESLVAFASVGDRLSLEPGPRFSLDIEGRFADKLEGRNLIERAVEYFGFDHPGLQTGAFRLEKRLPVAAGLGGGSADAAAALRLLAQANELDRKADGMAELAAKIGADVSVCLANQPAMMWGVGEALEIVPPLPTMQAVLVTPAVELATKDVFAALDAAPFEERSPRPPELPPHFETVEDVAAYAGSIGNDLLAVASTLSPDVEAVQRALRYTVGCHLVQLSGSGPTSFGLYCDQHHAAMAAANIGLNPDWWVVEATIG